MLRAFVLLLITTLLIVGTAWWYMQDADQQQVDRERQEQVDKGFLTTEKEFNDKLEEVKRRRNRVQENIVRMEQRKSEAEQEFRSLKVKTTAELEANKAAKRLYDDIGQYDVGIQKLQKDVGLFDEAVAAIESELRAIDRRKLMETVAINDESFKQLRNIINNLDEKLQKPESALDKLETQTLLDKINGDSE